MAFFDPESIITSGGLILVGLVVFAESALLIGFFLPGDTLLLAAGFFASQDKLPLGWLLLTIVVAAVIGDNVGYTIGRQTGKRIFKKQDGIVFKQEHLVKAEKFYEKHGGKTVTVARFMPVIRTFAPIVAGAAKMERRKFMFYNIAGALIWGVGVTMLGYFLGDTIPNIDSYLLPAVAVATFFTFIPPVVHMLKDAKTRTKLFAALKHQWNRFLRFISLNKEP